MLAELIVMCIAGLAKNEGASLKSAMRAFAFVCLGALAVTATGRVHVAPYERGPLADPTMRSEDTASTLEAHVRAISEGASGGIGGGGGGCGCN